jgi:hypothetical protein
MAQELTHASILQKGKGVETDTLALTEGTQDADNGPQAVSCLQNQHQDLSFDLAREVACGLREKPVQASALVSVSGHLCRGFILMMEAAGPLNLW